MKLHTLVAGLLLALPLAAQPDSKGEKTVSVVLDTSQGAITLELDAAKAPKTVANFVEYVKSGQFDGTIFHRVIPGFMAQGGGFDAAFREKPTRAPIVNEGKNGLKNARGTIAMARTNDPDSATAQFFINLVDNDFLDAGAARPGYAVFGKVSAGMDVVDKIAKIPTGPSGPFGSDVPKTTVTITKARVLEK
jgi:peptidyl-prolyl cis-trans isomerase B (cyclophilin B)